MQFHFKNVILKQKGKQVASYKLLCQLLEFSPCNQKQKSISQNVLIIKYFIYIKLFV